MELQVQFVESWLTWCTKLSVLVSRLKRAAERRQQSKIMFSLAPPEVILLCSTSSPSLHPVLQYPSDTSWDYKNNSDRFRFLKSMRKKIPAGVLGSRKCTDNGRRERYFQMTIYDSIKFLSLATPAAIPTFFPAGYVSNWHKLPWVISWLKRRWETMPETICRNPRTRFRCDKV